MSTVLGKMMRKFKALKRSSITKSTPSLNNLDFAEDIARYPSSVCSNYNQSDQQFDDNSSVLDGFIDLTVTLPDGKQVRMPIQARTPMMDVLVQVTTAHGINAGGMMLKVPIDCPPGYLHYKPNMPIGKLDCTSVEVVPKAVMCDRPRKQAQKGTVLPFEPTIRIQVNLPKNQKTFLRVNPKLTLGEIFHRICDEANLAPRNAYELRSAKSIGFPLCLDRRLEEVGIVDFTVTPVASCLSKSTNDILGAISRMSHEEKEKRKTKRFFGLLKRKVAAPQPLEPIEIQKITLNGQTAVEMRSPDKSKRLPLGKDRPISMPPMFLETSDGEASGNCHRSAVKPKKRQAPAPPNAQSAQCERSTNLENKDLAMTSADALRSHHARRGSDSSSGYHGSSQPSPNPPAVGDASGAVRASVQNASGSEKSTFSYKSHASGDGNGAKDDGVDICQKKKHKAPLPPGTPAGNEKSVGPAVAETQSTPAKDDPPVNTDSRCSTPATAEDVDKSFQEVIQHIENQISAEDNAATAAAKTDTTVEDVEPNLAPSPLPQEHHDTHNVQTPERFVNSEASLGTVEPAKRDDHSSPIDSVTRPTLKPTNLDAPLAHSSLDYQSKNEQRGVEETEHSELQSPVIPCSLSLQTDGLLMIKSVDQDQTYPSANVVDEGNRQPASGFGNKPADGRSAEQEIPLKEERNYPQIGSPMVERFGKQSTPCSFQISVKVKNQKEPVKKELIIAQSKVNSDVYASEKPRQEVVEPPGTNSASLSKTAPFNYPTSARPFASFHQQRPAEVNPGPSLHRPSIVLHDPKKGMYPSMKVKSFEDEYYTKSQGGVTDDYVKAVRYGRVNEFSAAKEEREKNKEKLEAAMAKKLNKSGQEEDRWQKPICVRSGATPKAGEQSPTVSRENSIPPRRASPAPSDDISVQLQREYEKLQAMFADWQFRLKQNESVIDSGLKLSPDQAISFQRLQDEMMEQHQYVQELCARVQRMEKGTVPDSPNRQMVERLEMIKDGSLASRSGISGSGRRPDALGARNGDTTYSRDGIGSPSAYHTSQSADQRGRACPRKFEKSPADTSYLPKSPASVSARNISYGVCDSSSPTNTAADEKRITYFTKSPSTVRQNDGAITTANIQNKTGIALWSTGDSGSAAMGNGQARRGQDISAPRYSPAGSKQPPPPIMPIQSADLSRIPTVGAGGAKFGTSGAHTVPKGSTVHTNACEGGDPRSDLLDSIRNFGGTAGLRKTPATGRTG